MSSVCLEASISDKSSHIQQCDISKKNLFNVDITNKTKTKLNVSITELNSPLAITLTRKTNPLYVSITDTCRKKKHLKVYCSIICYLSTSNTYLVVTEGEIHLDYEGNPVYVNVESNTSWVVE